MALSWPTPCIVHHITPIINLLCAVLYFMTLVLQLLIGTVENAVVDFLRNSVSYFLFRPIIGFLFMHCMNRDFSYFSV